MLFKLFSLLFLHFFAAAWANTGGNFEFDQIATLPANLLLPNPQFQAFPFYNESYFLNSNHSSQSTEIYQLVGDKLVLAASINQTYLTALAVPIMGIPVNSDYILFLATNTRVSVYYLAGSSTGHQSLTVLPTVGPSSEVLLGECTINSLFGVQFAIQWPSEANYEPWIAFPWLCPGGSVPIYLYNVVYYNDRYVSGTFTYVNSMNLTKGTSVSEISSLVAFMAPPWSQETWMWPFGFVVSYTSGIDNSPWYEIFSFLTAVNNVSFSLLQGPLPGIITSAPSSGPVAVLDAFSFIVGSLSLQAPFSWIVMVWQNNTQSFEYFQEIPNQNSLFPTCMAPYETPAFILGSTGYETTLYQFDGTEFALQDNALATSSRPDLASPFGVACLPFITPTSTQAYLFAADTTNVYIFSKTRAPPAPSTPKAKLHAWVIGLIVGGITLAVVIPLVASAAIYYIRLTRAGYQEIN